MKQLLSVFISLSLILPSLSQSKTEIGISGGGSFLQGDINADSYYKDASYCFGALVRYNLSHRYAFRVHLNYLNLKATDAKSSDQFRLLRNASFSASILDIAALFEFNFLPFKFTERYNSYSSYLNIGLGTHIIGPPVGLTLPMGFGIKKTIGRRWCIGAEYNIRKTFSDKFDGIENPGNIKSFFNNNDWYAFMSVVVSYKIFDELRDCPAYENDKQKWR